ncbi:MAG: 3,4-dihydroxy-2-butanone-4-phosphate synthase [Spirochaetes bacterium]|nr:3,4-dihydroxy-2-butanone-4-phosphate synthase [Spirochaetota bacterium]
MNQSVLQKQSIVRINNAITSLRNGHGIIIMDDQNRENEGDLVFPAQSINVKQMALLINKCSGIVCLCLPQQKAKELSLSLMVQNNTSKYKTAFTVSIEASEGVTTGVSAQDRLKTIIAAIADNARISDLNRPGHIFPLIAKNKGVLERQGHTEATVDIMKIAGLKPYGVLCELMNKDGSMANVKQIKRFSNKNKFPILLIEDIIKYKENNRIN